MELLEHQIRTAKTVLQRFRGKAMLCDEVGLGKTIEAGLIFAELRMRGLIRSALVLTPPSLIEQWQGEMRRKFSLELISHDDPAFKEHGRDAWNDFDFIIASIHTAKREPHRSAITARHWDLLIVDEAHHLRNRNTLVWKLASELQKQYALLLTATPVQNNLEELFNLVTLLEPGLLRTARQFQKHFVDKKDKLTPRHLDELHRLLSEVMVRNRRSNGGLAVHPPLGAHRAPAAHCPASSVFTRTWPVSSGLTCVSRTRACFSRMALLSLQMALGSTSPAAAGTLERLADTPQLTAADRATLLGLSQQAATAGREFQGQPPAAIAPGISGQAGGVHAVPGDAGHAASAFAVGGAQRGGFSRRPEPAGQGSGGQRVSRPGPHPAWPPSRAARAGICSSPMPCATSICPGTPCASSSGSAGSAALARRTTFRSSTW